jgi:hypothetical protein
VVAHAHGRKTEDDERALRRGYRIAIAALQTKHVLNRDSSMLTCAAHDLLRHGRRARRIMTDRAGAREGAALLAQQGIGPGCFSRSRSAAAKGCPDWGCWCGAGRPGSIRMTGSSGWATLERIPPSAGVPPARERL